MQLRRMNLEEEVEILLNGEGLDLKVFDYAPVELSPVTIRKTVCYIVSAIIFNDKNEVLMVQEAKQECYKQWYLPAGRMEENESIVDAMRREVKEEAGFDCQPITLLLVQEQGPQWIRFVFLAKITGGTLKTPAQADAESLQAQWWDQESPLALRGRDIIRLIESGRKYQQAAWHPLTLPLDMPCHVVAQRSIIAFSNSTGGLWILVTTLPRPHLPVAVAIKTHTVTWAASMAAQEALPSTYYDYDVNTLGVLSLQHSCMEQGKTDGLSLIHI